MKRTLILSLFILSSIITTSQQANAQQAYDTVCEKYKVHYSLEDALKDPLSVQRLDLSMQKITVIPEQLMQLKNLVCLDLAFNRMTSLPASFSTLSKLGYLNLTGTRFLSKVPSILSQMPNLKVVDLRDHPEWSAATYAEAVKQLPNITVITK